MTPVVEATARGAELAQFFLGDPQSWKTPTVAYHGGHVTAADDPAAGIDNWRKCVEGLDLPVPMFIEHTAGGASRSGRAGTRDHRPRRPRRARRRRPLGRGPLVVETPAEGHAGDIAWLRRALEG